MHRLKKHGETILTAALWLLFFLNLYFRNGLLLSSLDKNNLFYFDWSFFVNEGSITISAFKYLHIFITQFSYYPLLGASVILLLCYVFYLAYKALFKNTPLARYWALLFITGWQISLPYFGLYLLFMGIIIVAAFLPLIKIKNIIAKYIVGAVIATALFLLLKDPMEYVLYFDTRIVPPPVFFFMIIGTRKIICIVAVVLMLISLAAGVAGFIPKTAKILSSKITAYILCVFFLAGLSTTIYIDHSRQTILKSEKILNSETGKISSKQWGQVVTEVNNFYDNYTEKTEVSWKEREVLSGYAVSSVLMSNTNIERLFSYSREKAYTQDILYNLLHAFNLPILLMYYNTGFYAEALHLGYDQLVSMNRSYHNLNILINTCLKTAEYKPVKRLISRLDRTLFYRKRAAVYMAEVKEQPEQPLTAKSSQNFRVNSYSPNETIRERAKRSMPTDPNRAFLMKYSELFLLITKQISRQNLQEIGTQSEYVQFMRAYNIYRAGRLTKEDLKSQFSKTYYYYYYFE